MNVCHFLFNPYKNPGRKRGKKSPPLKSVQVLSKCFLKRLGPLACA